MGSHHIRYPRSNPVATPYDPNVQKTNNARRIVLIDQTDVIMYIKY